jgi:uncharacterized protein involved in exopolysaccharide biosynthesis
MDDELKLADLIAVVNQYKWFIIMATLLTVAVAAVATFLQTPVYEAKAQVLVAVEPLKRKTLEDLYYGTLVSEKLASTFSSLANDSNIIKEAANSVGAAAKKVKVETNAQEQIFTLTVQYPEKQKVHLLANKLAAVVMLKARQLSFKLKSNLKPSLTLAAKASLPEKPVKQNLKLNLIAGFVLGLIGSLALAFIINASKQSKETSEGLNLAATKKAKLPVS